MQPKYITVLFLVFSTGVYGADESDQESARKCDAAESMYRACLMANGKFWPHAVYSHAPQPMCSVQYFVMIEKCSEVRERIQGQNEIRKPKS